MDGGIRLCAEATTDGVFVADGGCRLCAEPTIDGDFVAGCREGGPKLATEARLIRSGLLLGAAFGTIAGCINNDWDWVKLWLPLGAWGAKLCLALGVLAPGTDSECPGT